MKKILVTITHVAEIEVDDRVTDADLEWATLKWDETVDGRDPFFTELAAHACSNVAGTFAGYLRDAVADRICDKYPGARGRWLAVVERLPAFKVHWRLRRTLTHRAAGDKEFMTNDDLGALG
ncbi:MAG TPA: hypothetical protein VFA98_06275 [Thermoanaerobaculia bacterium]|nr:hypothetical protein [Thermoanaerobaculia bacterium]